LSFAKKNIYSVYKEGVMANTTSKTTLGLDENIESVLCYAGIWVSGFLFLIIEKDNRNVRFHAMQSLVTFLGLSLVSFVLGRMLFFFWHLLGILSVCLWVLLIIKAYNGERFKLPIAGDIAENFIGKLPSPIVAEAKEQASAQPSSQEAKEAPLTEAVVSPAEVSSKPPRSSKEEVLKEVERILLDHPQLSVVRSKGTDIEIKSLMYEPDPTGSNKKVEYNACLLSRESDRVVLFWEMRKRSSSDFDKPGGFQTQVDSFNSHNGAAALKKESWDSSQLRSAIEQAVKTKGWDFKVVLTKSKAMY